MEIKLSSSSYVIRFDSWGNDYGELEIEKYIEHEIMPKINTESADGWTLRFVHVFCRQDFFGIYKRGRTYPSDKEKSVNIITPIPDYSTAIPWGIRQRKSEYIAQLDRNNFLIIPFNYEDYGSMKEYIIDCTRRGLHDLFAQGYTVAGKKIKFTKNHEMRKS
ncbi:hypothetical protein FACS1894116_00150 [Betaproteobacteria bacterium]|nr:hypothetical protein FACS1894116_00150 [Betaproteobacteria bacterium]GHT99322.1 hypothetical protein FACS1894154_06210 [Betaproteobacteria bacterium]